MTTTMVGGCSEPKRRLHHSHVILLVIFVASLYFDLVNTRPPNSLQFPSNSRFKIALFADLHYGENPWTDWGPAQDINSDRVMSTIIDAETPDFVVFLGDLVTANNIPIANASLYWDKALSPTRSRGIPWASVFGNHDDMPFEWPAEWFSSVGIPQIVCNQQKITDSDGISANVLAGDLIEKECTFRGTSRMELMKNEISKGGLTYSTDGPKELLPAASNYVLQLSSSDNSQSAVVFLYFLDSGGGSYPEVISSAQANWFRTQSQVLNRDSMIPEIIFWHIPSISYQKVAPNLNSRICKPCVGSINKERVAFQEAEWGIMDILSNRSSVKAVFVGHNHGLDWCCPHQNLWLCFARHTGYGGYGNWPRGARIIEITEKPFSLMSWIRMEDDTVHSNIKLV